MAVRPTHLAGHMLDKVYDTEAFSAAEFGSRSGQELNIDDIVSTFDEYCVDRAEASPEKATHALYFCDRVTYEIGPSSRQIAATDADKMWEFKFPKKDGKPRSVFVSTYRKTQNYRMEKSETSVGMTMKQANLLSVSILNTYNRRVLAGGSMVLTPLGGAIFSTASITQMMKAMGVSEKGAYELINSSTCSGGTRWTGQMQIVLSHRSCTPPVISSTRKKRFVTLLSARLSRTMPRQGRKWIERPLKGSCTSARVGCRKAST